MGRRTSSVVPVIAVLAIALGAGGCGGGNDPTSTAATQTQSSAATATRDQESEAAGFLGATLTTATAGEPGVVVQSVEPDSKSQLKRGDVIVAFNGAPVSSAEELIRAIGSPKVGEQFRIKVVRGSHRFTLTEVQSPSAYLGAEVTDATGEVKGAAVVTVAPNSPAATAELKRGDVITAFDDAPVRSVDQLFQELGTHGPGDTVRLTVSRGSRELEITATLADRPAPSR